MAADKIFCGSGKKKEFNNGGSVTDVMLDLDVLNSNFQEHGFTTTGGKRMIKIKVSTKREPDQYGKTHSAEIDTWKPEQQQGGNNNQSYDNFPSGNINGQDDPEADIPF